MILKIRTFAAAVIVAVVMGAVVRAQEPRAPMTQLRVQVVISKYQADKKTSSLPYTLTVSLNDPRNVARASVRMGAQVPIATTTRPSGNADAAPVPTIQYRDVGTSIDCAATSADDGRFKLELTIDDSSVYSDTAQGVTGRAGNPAFRSFRASNTVLLKDGQSAQYTSATDKVSGEVVKVDVTLTVVK